MKEELTKEIEKLQVFFGRRPLIIIGTGTSCAIDKEFGMSGLRGHLEKQLDENHGIYKLNKFQQEEWNKVVSDIQVNKDFEAAMNNLKDKELLTIIVNETASLIAIKEKEVACKILTGEKKWPATRLISRLIDKRINEHDLHIVTTNYDCLAEYAFTYAKIPYITGFAYGVCGSYDWDKSKMSMKYYDVVCRSKTTNYVTKTHKHICLHKIHGSINVFKFGDFTIENDSWMYEPPDCVERVMITPGTSKHEEILKNVGILYKEFIIQRDKHDSFLFIGFGFNDNQIVNDDMDKKLINQKCPALILTKDINDRIMNYMDKCENLWTVYNKHEADNENANITKIYNCKYNKPFIVDYNLWDADKFYEIILGG